MDGKGGEGADKVAVLQLFRGSVVILEHVCEHGSKSDDNSPVSILLKPVTMWVNLCQRNCMAKINI